MRTRDWKLALATSQAHAASYGVHEGWCHVILFEFSYTQRIPSRKGLHWSVSGKFQNGSYSLTEYNEYNMKSLPGRQFNR